MAAACLGFSMVLEAIGGLSCQTASDEPPSRSSRQARGDWSFRVIQPSDRIELRGEGSESLMAPRGAALSVARDEVSVSHEAFSLRLSFSSPPLRELLGPLPSRSVVYRDDSTLIAQIGDQFAAAVVVERAPEWDPSDARRLLCTTAGWEAGRLPTSGLPRDSVQAAVAACHTLQLPSLQ